MSYSITMSQKDYPFLNSSSWNLFDTFEETWCFIYDFVQEYVDLYEEFNDTFDDIYDTYCLGYLEFTASEILKNCDPIAYNEAYLDYKEAMLEELKYSLQRNSEYTFYGIEFKELKED